MNLKNLSEVLPKLSTAYEKLKKLHLETAKIQEEISDYLGGKENWNLSSAKPPTVGDRIITGERKDNKESYSVIDYTGVEPLYQYWMKLDKLPVA